MKYILLFFTLISFQLASAGPAEDGKLIFKARCASCHQVNKILVGPALADVEKRRSLDWIVNFVHSSQAVIRGGDKEAVALFAKFNNIPMPDHPDLSAQDIGNIVEYIKAEAVAGKTAVKAPFGRLEGKKETWRPLGIDSAWALLLYLGLVVLLIMALLTLVRVKEQERSKLE